ncbi:hypothetical protein Q3G72_013969 [Acer saccharum]|nr:hypothetical protein Q3G72_013969 [Acer saccharum]
MESRPDITMDWVTYSSVADIYIKAGLNEKALICLKKCEEKISKDASGYNHLISHYASLGNKDEMMRLWGLQLTECEMHINRDYITMMYSLVKIGELEETEKLLTEWESSCDRYDFRVPNALLIGYSAYLDKDNMEKAFECMKEALAVQAENKFWRPKPSSISSILDWVRDNRNADEIEAFMRSLKTGSRNYLD